MFFELLYGSYPEQLQEGKSIKGAFRELLGAKEVICQPATFDEYISLLENLSQKVTPLTFSSISKYLNIKFSSTFQLFPTGYRAIISDGLVDDLFLFHIIRWYTKPAIYVLVEDCHSENSIQAIAEWIGPKIGGNVFPIGSFSVDIETMREFRERLRKYLPSRDPAWHIDISWGNFGASIATLAHSERKQQSVTVQNSRVIADIPDFQLRSSSSAFNRWVTEVDLSPAFGNRRGFLPSMFRDLNFLLSGYSDPQMFYRVQGNRTRRIARDNLSLVVGRDNYLAEFTLPDSEQLIKTALENDKELMRREAAV